MTACPLRASRATGILQGQVQDARVTGRFEAARTSAAASAASAAEAGSDHSRYIGSSTLRTGYREIKGDLVLAQIDSIFRVALH